MSSMYFTEEHEAFRASFKDFLQKEVVPFIDKWEKTGTIEKFIWKVIDVMKSGGRLFYFGCGTSGRLGVLDASECPPTFSVDSSLIQGVIAGGNRALTKSVENAEDEIEEEKINEFITSNLGKNATVPDHEGEESLSDILHNDSEELKVYMQEVMPDRISILAEELGQDANDVKDLILDQARWSDLYKPGNGESSNFTYAVDAMNFYLSDYIF